MSNTNPLIRPVVAEFFGTFLLTSAVLATTDGIVPIAGAIAAGLMLALMVLVIGPISGAHINPAVTIGLWSRKSIALVDALSYIAAQVSGALVALLVFSMFHDGDVFALGVDSTNLNAWSEMAGAAIFGFGIAGAVYNKLQGVAAAFAIGGSLFMGLLFASSGSAGVLNPAVAFGLQAGTWPYLLGPVVGMVVGMNVFGFLEDGKKSKK